MRKVIQAGLWLLLLVWTRVWAQQYTISTIAGGVPPLTPVAGVRASIGAPFSVATDTAGNVYFSSEIDCVFRLDGNGMLTHVAGNSRRGFSGDGGLAINAKINNPFGVVVDRGMLYIADYSNNRVRKITPEGVITTLAGNGIGGYSGDGGLATSAQLYSPRSLTVDSSGNLYIADSSNFRIRKVSPAAIITTVVGNGVSGYSGDGGPAADAQLGFPTAVTADANGNLFIVDLVIGRGTSGGRIRKVTPAGVISTFAGNGTGGFSGDGGPATDAQLSPSGIAVDNIGNLYIAEVGNNRIRKVSVSGIINTVAGNGTQGFSGDNGLALNAQVDPVSVTVDASGNLYIADQYRIRRVSAAGIITTVAGDGTVRDSGDGAEAVKAQLNSPGSVAFDRSGNLYVVDALSNRVRKISTGGTIFASAGTGSQGYAGDGGLAISAQFNTPSGIAVDSAGNLYIADNNNRRVRKVSLDGIITTVAGNGTGGSSGDGGLATNAQLSSPSNITVGIDGSLYIADANHIRKVSPDGFITTVAGSLPPGYSGDGGPALGARLNMPNAIAVDNANNLYIADSYNHRIRKVSRDGIIATFAGNGTAGFSGDGGLATNAQIRFPSGLALDNTGNLFFADTDNHRIRKVSPDGIITTIAGSNSIGFSGDGGLAIDAELNFPYGVALDSSENIYVGEIGNHAIRRLQIIGPPSLGAVTNGASNLIGPISPGEVVVLYGSDIGPAHLTHLQLDGAGRVATTLGETQVFFNGIPAPLIYTWTTQVAAVVPYEVSSSSAQVQVSYQGHTSNQITVQVMASSPGIFTFDSTGRGQAAAINQDNSINGANRPSQIGSVISLYATGEGQSSPPGINGQLAGPVLPHPILPFSVTIGGIPAQAEYSGGAPGMVAGVMQVNARIPEGVQPGNAVPVIVTIGNASNQPGVTIAVATQ